MRIPRFWALGRCDGPDPVTGERATFSAWGWSFGSEAAAAEDAQKRANRIVAQLAVGVPRSQYGYFDRPIREEILETFTHGGDEHAVITRNQYGSLVLNSSRVLFADIDFPKVIPRGFWDSVQLTFSRQRRLHRKTELEQATWNRVRQWAEAHADRGFRLYRTAAGMRLAFTDRLYDPTESDTAALLEVLGSDPLYRRLTQAQECFRARLTPKPWRCGQTDPPHRFPLVDSEAIKDNHAWLQEYAARSKGYRACEFVGEFGTSARDEVVETTVRIHDERACKPDGAPLA